MSTNLPKYLQLAEASRRHLENTGRVGERLMSLRDFASRERVSISTAQRVYEELERSGVVESRPRSGYYLLTPKAQQVALPTASRDILVARTEQELMEGLMSSAWHAHKFSAFFASGKPDTSTAGARELSRVMRRLAKRDLMNYGPLLGDALLRQEIAANEVRNGLSTQVDDILITNGAQEALYLGICAITQPGDLIAVESPTYYGLTSAITQSGRKMVEIPSDSRSGICLPALELAMNELPVKAVVVSSSVQNPLGCSMHKTDMVALVELINQNKLAVIDDDTHGELLYARHRQCNLKAFDTEDRVLLCSTFSKTLAPELRIGWLEGARWHQQVVDLKRAVSARSVSLPQHAIAHHMAEGHYCRHVRLSRDLYASRARALRQHIADCFPAGTCISNPTGGYQLWVELPANFSAMALAEFALSQGIVISPGKLFSHREHYGHCVRLCYSNYTEEQRSSIELMAGWLSREGRMCEAGEFRPA